MFHASLPGFAPVQSVLSIQPVPADAAIWALPLTFIVAFLIGSVPWGVIISRMAFGKDIRSEGSGNIGTTNALRTLGKAGGAAVFLLDFGKGLLVGFLADALVVPALPGCAAIGLALAFMGCTFGHVFSPWLKGRGGKGIAVAAACLLFVYGPWGFLAEICAFALGILFTRCVSVGSIAAAVLCPLLGLFFFWGHWVAWGLITLTAGVVIWAHRGNIARLRAGTENRVGGTQKEGAK